jgi:biotin-(acetyl-CoA carboxylase) ligase
MIKMFNLKVYNLSDGAYINGSIPLKDKTLPKIDKEKIKKEIISSFEKIDLTPKKLNLLKIIKPTKALLKKPTNNLKELTGLIDFIDNALDITSKDYQREYHLLRGSISHILNNLYILSHKVKQKDREKLKQLVINELSKFYSHFEKNFNKSFKE